VVLFGKVLDNSVNHIKLFDPQKTVNTVVSVPDICSCFKQMNNDISNFNVRFTCLFIWNSFHC
jgi:hypothetical protein